MKENDAPYSIDYMTAEELPYDKTIWERKFYPQRELDYRRLRLSKIGYYSITKAVFIDKIVSIIRRRFRNPVITDATAGMGMISIILAKYYKVHAVELLQHHVEIIRHNMQVYGVNADNLTVTHGDYTKHMGSLRQDVLIIDPPWKQSDESYYKSKDAIDLFLSGINIVDIFNDLLDQKRVKLIILFAPYNFNMNSFHRLGNVHKVSIYRLRHNKHYLVTIEA